MESVTLVRGFKEPNTRQVLVPVPMPVSENVGPARGWNGRIHGWHRGRL